MESSDDKSFRTRELIEQVCCICTSHDEVAWHPTHERDMCVNCLNTYAVHVYPQERVWTPFGGINVAFYRWVAVVPPHVEVPHAHGADDRRREYWYFLTWTHDDNHTINDTRKNIALFVKRDLGIIACDIVLERGEVSGREHIHMRLKTSKPLKKQRVQHYRRTSGNVDFVVIKKHTRANWDDKLAGYMSKEHEIETLV